MTRTLIGLVMATTLLAGCAWGGDEPKTRKVTPADFTAPGTAPGSGDATSIAQTPGVVVDRGIATTTDDPAVRQAAREIVHDMPPATITATPLKPGEGITVAGMVGQVNGQPIYARAILDPMHEQLIRLGESLPEARFRQEIRKPIAGILQETVFNALILGEAERDLSENERKGLRFTMTDRREELIRRWGAGAPLVADQALLEKTGKGLEATVEDLRIQMVIQRYLAAKLHPKINVTRKDIERYYNDHPEIYQPSAWRTIRLIRAADESAMRQVQQMLDEGRDFAEVAASPVNSFNVDHGGLLGEKMKGEELLVVKPLNAEMLKLKAGQTSPMVKQDGSGYWVHVQAMDTGKARTLREVQKEIEDVLRRQQFQALTARYRDELFKTGTFNPLKDMTDALVEIAVTRYAAGK